MLGRVIEAVTGSAYADHVQAAILAPSGVADMAVAGDTAAQRQPREVMYAGVDLQAPYALKVRRMDAHGGWLASPVDLLRFVLRVDGFPVPPDVLQPATVTAMTTPSAANPGYARGWAVNAAGTRWHDGTLPGTQAILVRTAGQRDWAAACNTGGPNTAVGLELDQLMWSVDALL
jgi:CubicO group peptidase (beta-lactamase class C family)